MELVELLNSIFTALDGVVEACAGVPEEAGVHKGAGRARQGGHARGLPQTAERKSRSVRSHADCPERARCTSASVCLTHIKGFQIAALLCSHPN